MKLRTERGVLLLALAVAGCGSGPGGGAADAAREDASQADGPQAAAAQGDAAHPIVDEARAFMEGYATDLRSGRSEDIAARYSRRGAYLVFPGDRRLEPYEGIVRRYREGGPAPEVFEWRDLSYEPVGEDAVMVVGAFRWESAALDGVLGTYTALLVREEGELRIRLENESFDNLPPAQCADRPEPCDLPLDASGLARYTGEYETPGAEGRTRVFTEGGRLMMRRPGQPAGRLLHEGGHAFRVEGAPSLRVVFDGGGGRATSYVVFTGMMQTRGSR